MQPGGHRFETGILHQVWSSLHRAGRTRKIGSGRLSAQRSWPLQNNSALLQLNILQTVVFSDHNTRSVQGINGCDGQRKLSVAVVSFEFLWSSY